MKPFRVLLNRQEGAALAVALILLVVMTLLGLSSVKTITQQERMVTQSFDRSLAFQGAEAALRAGEQAAELQSKLAPANSGFPATTYLADGQCASPATANDCTAGTGQCSQPDPDCPVRWLDPVFNNWRAPAGLNVSNLTGTPEYFVEYLGARFPCFNNINACNVGPGTPGCNCHRYRVTARVRVSNDPNNANSPESRVSVMLQSVYAPI